MLEVQDIHTYYGNSYVLQGVSLEVGEGKVAALLGRNGVGKTTLLRSIIGFTPPRRGRIFFRGADVTSMAPYRIARLGIGLVPQGRRIFGSLTVRENLSVAQRGNGGQQGWTIGRVMDFFPRLREREKHWGTKLSGGEQQMLACGRGLLTNPMLLLMDEPSEGLAPLLVRELEHLILRLKEQGVTILLAEQRFGFALAVADHIYVMSHGRIVHEATPDELRHNEEVKHTYLGV
ncbi:MAG: ABC transporter ATP-binding protein [Chloroflexi bacterium]|nr:ABC transporter ATP-binding protein [Chloroflexota bacterium]